MKCEQVIFSSRKSFDFYSHELLNNIGILNPLTANVFDWLSFARDSINFDQSECAHDCLSKKIFYHKLSKILVSEHLHNSGFLWILNWKPSK